MWNSEDYGDHLVENWERCVTENGIPYYINHKLEKTDWDHPVMKKTLDELGDFDSVRLAAYRVAMKLRFLQKRLNLDLIDLSLIVNMLERHGIKNKNNVYLNCVDLHKFVADLFLHTGRRQLGQLVVEQSAELVINWLLNLYDVRRMGHVRVISVKVALATLCSAKLHEKYKFFFQQIADHNNFVNKESLGLLLHDLMQIPSSLNEASPFGGLNVAPAVENCFQNSINNLGISELVLLDWLLQEPQTLVWLPMIHRQAAAETVKHEAKCNTCKAFPIIGFRYRCLKCFNYDMCQDCFLTGQVNKKHKLTHPTQEHCMVSTSKDDTKAFMRTIRNNLSKRQKQKTSKSRYLPIPDRPDLYNTFSPGPVSHHKNPAKSSDTDDSSIPDNVDGRPRPYKTPPMEDLSLEQNRDNWMRLEDIIQKLDHENRELLAEIELMNHRSETSSERSNNSETELLWRQKEKMELHQQRLQKHNAQLEDQLKRLQATLQKKDKESNPANDYTPKHPNSTRRTATESQQTHSEASATSHLTHSPVRNNNTMEVTQRDSPLPSYESIVQHLREIANSLPRPTHNLQSLRNSAAQLSSTGIVPTFSTPAAGPATVKTPKSVRLETKPRRIIELSPNVSYEPRAEDDDDLTRSWWDTRMSASHFSLPSPGQSRVYPDEEQELQDIINQMENAYPADMNFSAVGNAANSNNEILAAANKIGTAMTQFVGHMSQGSPTGTIY